MRNSSRFLVPLILLLTLLVTSTTDGSAATKTKGPVWAEPKDDMAIVYFVRRHFGPGSGATVFLFESDGFVGVLDDKTYTYAYFTPGRYFLWTSLTQFNTDIELGPNTVTYLDLDFHRGLEIINESDGRELIEKIKKYVEPSPKEIARSEKYITKRLAQAQTRAETQGRGEVEVVPVPARPDDTTGMVRIPQYTVVHLELMETVSSRLTETGDSVWFRVVDEVITDDSVVLGKGALVRGTIRRAADARSFGRPGQMNITIPSVVTGDRTVIPTVGQTSDTGDRLEPGMRRLRAAFGVMAGGIKGHEAFELAGATCRVWTLDEAWVRPLQETDHGEEASVDTEKVFDMEPVAVEFEPHHRKEPGEVVFVLDTPKQPAKVRIQEVDGWELPAEVTVSSITRSIEGGWAFVFADWDVIRFLRPEGIETDIRVVLKGTFKDGTTFSAASVVTLRLSTGAPEDEPDTNP